MKTITVISNLLRFATIFATAAPLDVPRQDIVRRARKDAAEPYYRSSGHAIPPGTYPTASGYPAPSSSPVPSGFQPPYPTGTAPANPSPSTSTATSCFPNGVLVCNGLYQWGLCNWGKVVWQPVANGTACVDGAITWAPDYPY